MEYVLQSRLKLEKNALYYYGLRRKERLFRNRIRLSGKQIAIVASLPRELSEKELKTISFLIKEELIVPKGTQRIVPSSINKARFCTECAANDFIIPGLEFEKDGKCPLCSTSDSIKKLKSIVPIVSNIPKAKNSRFDVALFYTGGKDSTFMLYHLSKVLGLRVLALTWEIPFMSESAIQSIENSKKCFKNVEFRSRRVNDEELKRIYRKLYQLSSNTCACPSLAYVLFYPDLVREKVPYFLAGNEPVQMLGLYYNSIAPKIAFSYRASALFSFALSVARIFLLRPPLKKGQLHTLLTMKQLAYGDHPLKKLSGYVSPLVSNVVEAIHTVPELIEPFRKAIYVSSKSGNIPAFVHLDLDAVCGGRYDWENVREILVNKCGWIAPANGEKALHTSCRIERCKDHTQFIRFYRQESKMIPFSALEIALASRRCGKSREQMIEETEKYLGFTLSEPCECEIMREYMEI